MIGSLLNVGSNAGLYIRRIIGVCPERRQVDRSLTLCTLAGRITNSYVVKNSLVKNSLDKRSKFFNISIDILCSTLGIRPRLKHGNRVTSQQGNNPTIKDRFMTTLRLSRLIIPFLTLISYSMFAQTGKIAGTVKDAHAGEALVAANIVIEGTTLGSATNLDGYFVVLGVPPGLYRVRASMIGYAPLTLVDVRVSIDQTTQIEFQLTETVLETQEVVVVASRPVVQKDVSASTANLNFREIQHIPAIKNVSDVIALQAGIQVSAISGDLIIRGGGADQTAFMLDGNTLRDERTNKSFLGVSLTAVQDIQIQTGGFNAEYGNVRSGIVNVVTKEGSPISYTAGLIARYSPPAPKNFGGSPNSRNSFWIRPYVDPDVAWTGTKNGAWDKFTREQYPEFEGWNALAQKTLLDNDPTNDLTPEAAQRIFLFQHRKKLNIEKPDYDIDASFGGPVPFVSSYAGNLRFHASYRALRNMYLVPLSTDSYREETGQVKITSDVGTGMKLMVEGLWGRTYGTNDNNAGLAGVFSTPNSIASQLDRVSYIDARIFATDYWAPSTIGRQMFGAKFTHVLSSETFYEVRLQQFATEYSTNPGRLRDTSRVYRFGNAFYLDEAPFGFQPQPSTGIDGLRMGVGFSNSRDASRVAVTTARFDITSQLDRYNQIKAGVEFIYTDNNVNYASVDVFLPSGRSRSVWHTYPVRGAAYLQDKLEFEGMIANLGVRLDYSNPRGDWYIYNPYDPILVGNKSLEIDTKLEKEPVKKNLILSPRLGVAFPITEFSKMYFNYGHFFSMPTPENLFLVRRFSDNNSITFLANPNNPLPRTVAYELGYEHSLFDQLLLRLAGYYKDVTNQLTSTRYVDPSTGLRYSVSTANSYADIRGFEVTVSKTRGSWVQGFLNYTYMVTSGGRFGYAEFSKKPSDRRKYEAENIVADLYQSKPVPQPYARMNIDFFTPGDFGPTVAGIGPLSDLRLSLLSNYSAGSYFTWTGGGGGAPLVTGIGGAAVRIENNVQWRDYYNIDLRLSKAFKFSSFQFEIFADISNVLNIKYFNAGGYGFKDGNDFDAYIRSLHLSASIGDQLSGTYINIPGDDRPGDYRKAGVRPAPIKGIESTNLEANPLPSYIYYVRSTKKYMQYKNGQWNPVNQKEIDQILKDKAYIDMPNLDYFTFLNPRDIYFGLRLSVDL